MTPHHCITSHRGAPELVLSATGARGICPVCADRYLITAAGPVLERHGRTSEIRALRRARMGKAVVG